MNRFHVIPFNDVLMHDCGDSCFCAPVVEYVFDQDGARQWLVIHNSVDAREHLEDLRIRRTGYRR